MDKTNNNPYGMTLTNGQNMVFDNADNTAPKKVTTPTQNYTPKPSNVPTNQTAVPASDAYLKGQAYLASLNGGKTTEPIIKSAFEPEYQDDPYADIGNYYKDQMSQEVNPQDIYNQKLNQWQGYMDSLKSVYANKALEVDKQITGQLGTNRATQARSGLIGSTFGGAQNTKVENAGLEQKRILADEMDAKVRYLMGEINRDVSSEIAAKRQAIAQGTESYTKFLAEGQQRKLDQVNRISMSAMQQGIKSIDELGADTLKEMSQKLGMTTSDIKYYFNTLKKQQEVEAAKTEREGQFNLSEGQARYNSDGSLIASKGKTYAPSSGSSGSSGTSSQAESWAELINSGRATIANVPSAMRSQVSQALAEIPQKSIVRPEQITALLDNPKFDKAFGPVDARVPKFGEAALARNQMNQILAQLKLDNRKILKGQGAVSDFEGRTLGEAASIISPDLNENIARRLLTDLRATIQGMEGEYYTPNTTAQPEGKSGVTSTGLSYTIIE